MYSPSAGSEAPVALELSDRYELAGAALSHGGYDPAPASCAGCPEARADDGADVGADVGDGGGSESLIGGAPEAQPATRNRAANAVAMGRFINAQTPATRERFRTVALPDAETSPD
jgi:hypothetical protein